MRVMTAQRLATLTDDVSTLLQLVAVLDDLATPDLLRAALDWPDDRYEATLGQARSAGLLGPRDALPQLGVELREGILSGLGLAELAELNSRAGRALLIGDPPSQALTRAAWHLIAGEAESELAGRTAVAAMQRLLADHNLDALRTLGNRAITLTSGAVQRQFWPAIAAMLAEATAESGPAGIQTSVSNGLESEAARAQARVILLRHSADVPLRKRAAAELEHLAQDSSDPYWRFAPVMNRIFEAGRAGDLDELEVLCDQMAGIVEDAPSGRLRWLHWLTVSVLQLDRGDLAASQQAMEWAARAGTAAGVLDAVHVQAFQQCVTAFHYRGVDGFIDYFEEILAATPGISFGRAVLALAYAQLGDRERTLAEAELAWQRILADPTEEYRPFNIAIVVEALAALPPGPHLEPNALAATLYQELAPFAGQFLTAGSILAGAGPANRYLGLAAWLTGDIAAAQRHLRLAVEEATASKMPLWRLRSLADLIRLLAWHGDAEARELAQAIRPEVTARQLAPCIAVCEQTLA